MYFVKCKDNYPEILKKAYVVPVNSVTRMIFAAASSSIDEKSRGKIHLVKDDEISWWKSIFHPMIIPRDLGGWSDGYESTADYKQIQKNKQQSSSQEQLQQKPHLSQPPPPPPQQQQQSQQQQEYQQDLGNFNGYSNNQIDGYPYR